MTEDLKIAYEEYIKFLERVIGDSAVFLHTHHMPASKEDIEMGMKLRHNIKSLSTLTTT